MYTEDMLEACPLVAVGSFIYKLRPINTVRKDVRGNWEWVDVLTPVGVPVVKSTFDSEKVAQWVAEACNFYAEHLKQLGVSNEVSS
jgi:hypothetical protein